MAAFSSLGIDNAVVEVSAREIPILDGSSAPLLTQLMKLVFNFNKPNVKFYLFQKILKLEMINSLLFINHGMIQIKKSFPYSKY